jgi:hypothetical protein
MRLGGRLEHAFQRLVPKFGSLRCASLIWRFSHGKSLKAETSNVHILWVCSDQQGAFLVRMDASIPEKVRV